ncbi:MAG: hypothetical protein LBM23_06910 [Propionibacteriaceae bacterium]|jgi:beta-glucuronidase|nr:hypothetical protein [Propionibacteriaceae bacterium]
MSESDGGLADAKGKAVTTVAGNYQDNIHRVDYLAPYENDLLASGRSPVIDAGTLFDLGARITTSLDGDWRFAIDPYDTCLRARWFEEEYEDASGRPLPVDFSFDAWEKVSVPHTWNVDKELWYWYEGSGVYVRDFEAAVPERGERLFLHFGGANYATYIFLNGVYCGFHRGGSTPFAVEITGQLAENNRLVVVVSNRRKREYVPTDNTDWFNYGGLHRSVSLVRLPETFIATPSVLLRPDGSYSTIDVTINVDGPMTTGTATVEIPELGIKQQVVIHEGGGRAAITANPQLWSPDDPKLYEVTIRYGDDTWSDSIGFREIRTDGISILLNGQRIFLAGVSQHEESVEHGRSLTEQEIRRNFTVAKELGCVFVRLAHYPHAPAAARIADQVGLLLWEEVPVYWAIEFDNPATLEDATNQIEELVVRDRNRASVIIWSVGNENADSDDRLRFMTELATRARDLDPTRLISAACLVDDHGPQGPVIADRLADVIDIIGINEYYGWYNPDFDKLPLLFVNSSPTKPVVITEFGADAVAGSRGDASELFTEDHQLAVYQLQIEVLSTIPYIQGMSPWILYDFRCPRRTSVTQGYYNRKGLLDATLSHRKLAFSALQEFYLGLPGRPGEPKSPRG